MIIIILILLSVIKFFWVLNKKMKIFSYIYYHSFIPNKREYLKQFGKKYEIFASFRFFKTIFTIIDSNIIEIVFKINQNSIGRSFSFYPGSSIMKRILPHLDNDDWRRVKKIMVKGFKSKNIKIFNNLYKIILLNQFNSVILFLKMR